MISITLAETILPLVPAIDESAVERAAQVTLQISQAPAGADLAVLITDDQQLHSLNLQYLGVDAPTDVLSFAEDMIDPDTGTQYLGDILISYPRASAQADAAGHPVQAEIQLLVVHGVLHLLGHDHAEPEDKEHMWLLQAQALKELGLGDIQVPST